MGYLTQLKATQNQFTSVHEDAAAGWPRLTVLNLNRNRLASLPSAAAAWAQLRSLDLRANALAALDEAAAAAWTRLEVRDDSRGRQRPQSGCAFHWPLASFSLFLFLSFFYFFFARPIANVRKHVSQVAKLGMNQLAALPPSVGSWTCLKSLYLTDNKLGDLPLELARCDGLEVLHCGVNLLKDLPALFGADTPFVQLRDLELYRNKLALLPEDFCQGFPMLVTLSLSGNALKTLPAGVGGGCLALKELHLANNAKLSKLPDELKGCGKLEYLSLAGCAAVKGLPQSLVAAWPGLKELDVRSGAKKEKCKLTVEWVEAAASRGFLLRGGIPPKKKKGKGKK